MRIDLSDVNVGDKLFSCRYGDCHVICRDNAKQYGVSISCEHTDDEYQADGKEFKTDIHPTLFHSLSECQTYFAQAQEPLPELEVDAKIEVQFLGCQLWQKRHFKRWSEDGKPVCFMTGETSWTTDGDETTWHAWRLPSE